MEEDNIHNVLYFENTSMYGLFDDMYSWQKENKNDFSHQASNKIKANIAVFV